MIFTIFLKRLKFSLMFSKSTKPAIRDGKNCLLKIAEAHYQYYEDQRTTRKGYCTLDPVPFTSTDIRFQSRIIQVKKS